MFRIGKPARRWLIDETHSRLSLTQLATLREFASRGTLAAAAERLGYTPGAVSQHLAALERTLGVPLTERSGRILLLTEAGQQLARHAEALLDAEADAVLAVRSSHERVAGPLLVGAWGSTAAGLLSPVVRRMAASCPEVELRAREIDVDQAVNAVRHGDVDVAFGLDYPDAPMARDDSISVVQLIEEQFCIAVAASQLTSQSFTVPIEYLAELDWILPPEASHYGRAFRYGCRRRGFEPRVVHEVTDTAASLQLAAAGTGATPMTELMRRLNPSVGLVGLTMAEPLTRQIILLTRTRLEQRPAVESFIEAARGAVRATLGE